MLYLDREIREKLERYRVELHAELKGDNIVSITRLRRDKAKFIREKKRWYTNSKVNL